MKCKIHELSETNLKEHIERARKMAMGTINAIYDERADECCLTDDEIDSVRDAMKVLYYAQTIMVK